MKRAFALVAALALPTLAQAEEARQFDDWSAICQEAGCMMDAGEPGARLAFVEPRSGDPMLLLIPDALPGRGEMVTATLAGFPGAALGPGDGWRLVEYGGGQAIQLSPTVTREEFEPRFGSAASVEFGYVGADGSDRHFVVPLAGYAAARDWIDANR